MKKIKKRMKSKKGFTLIELVLVITVLGILAVAALPSFIDVSTNARQSSRDGVSGAVRSGIGLFRANDLVQNGPPGTYPATLDAVADGTTCSAAAPCFGNIMQQPIADSAWSKTNATTYVFDDGTSQFTYTYTPASGTFTSPTAP